MCTRCSGGGPLQPARSSGSRTSSSTWTRVRPGAADRRIELTTTEYNLLLLFMRHPRKVLTRDVIMEHVWAYDFEGESNVLEVYVRYLRSKLEAAGEARLIHTVRGAGYVLKDG